MTTTSSGSDGRHWHKTLSARIALAFGSLMAFTWISTLYIELYGIPGDLAVGWVEHVRQNEFQRLSTEAEGSRIEIESWIKDRRNTLELIAEAKPVRALLESDTEATGSRRKRMGHNSTLAQNTAEWLAARRSSHGMIDNLVVLDADTGEVLAADDLEATKTISKVLAVAHTLLSKTESDELLEIVQNETRQSQQLLVARKIYATSPQTASAYLVALIDLEDYLKENIEARLISFVGATAELNLYDDMGRFIVRPRMWRDANDSPAPQISADNSRLATLAQRGGEGYILTDDYRHEVVLAAYRYIRVTPEIGWGLVIKKDQKETLKAIRDHTDVFVLLTTIGLIGVLVASLWVAQRITQPLRIVVTAARAISRGDWQARALVSNQTEIADLAVTFNEMAERLGRWHEELAEQVRLKTEQIHTEEGKLASFTQTTIDAMVIIDDAGSITFWNPAAERIFGYSAAEAIGCEVHTLLAPDILRPTATAALAHFVVTGEGPIVNSMREVPALTKDGREIIVELMISALTQNGRQYAIGTLRDVTHRKRTENALRLIAEHLSEKVGDEYFRSLAATLAELLKADYVLVSELDAACEENATTVGAFSPKGLIDNFTYVLTDSPCAKIISGAASVYPRDLQARFPKDISLIEMQVESYAGVALTNKDGKSIGLIAVLWRSPMPDDADTETQALLRIFAARAGAELERLHAERALAHHLDQLEVRVAERTAELSQKNSELADALAVINKAQGELIEAEKLASLGSLVAGVAHELNTPIGNSVMASTALSEKIAVFQAAVSGGDLKRSALNDFLRDLDEGGRYIANNLARSSELIQGFKQVAVDQTSSHRRRFELKRTVDEVAVMLKPRIKKTTHHLVIQVPENIILDSYPGPFGQMLTNLIQNSLVHAFVDRNDGHISISAQVNGDVVRLLVADDGCGMTEHVLDHVFDPFFTTKMGLGGSGLGMNITYNLVTGVLGGRIAISSAAGTGTTVRVELPLVAPGQNPQTEVSEISKADTTP